jgi:hypothetical protein
MLGPKHHQESIMDIVKYIWSLCINCIRLNMMTIPAEYLIPCCNDVFMYGFEGAVFCVYSSTRTLNITKDRCWQHHQIRPENLSSRFYGDDAGPPRAMDAHGKIRGHQYFQSQ